jgi:hypothetical protein
MSLKTKPMLRPRQEASNLAAFILIPAIGAVLVYFAWFLPIHIDEAITHRYFAAQGWKIAISTYPFPNNHVLFSFLASIFLKLPLEPLTAMRLVSVASALCNSALLYTIVKKFATPTWAILAVCAWVTSLGGFYYSIHARGYGLETTFILLCVYAILQRRGSHKEQTKHLLLFVMSSALGFFTIPSFLFPFVSLLLAWALCGPEESNTISKKVRHGLVAGTGTSLITLLFYMPLFYYSGFGALLNNQWVDERKWTNLTNAQIMSFIPDVYAYIGPTVLALLCLGLVIGLLQGRKSSLFILVMMVVPPIFIGLVMGSIPVPRTFAYLSAIFTVIAFWELSQVKTDQIRYFMVIGIMLVIYSSLSLNHQHRSVTESAVNQAKQIHAALSAQQGADTIYVNGWSECGQLIDYFTWLEQKGPVVRFVYKENEWEDLLLHQQPMTVLQEGGKEPNLSCDLILNRGTASFYRCN